MPAAPARPPTGSLTGSLTASLLFAALVCSACEESAATAKRGNGGDRPEERPPLVRVETVKLRRVQRKIETTAYLEAEHLVIVYARVVGRVANVLVDEGAPVTKGQILAELDDREVATTLKQVQVQVVDRKLRLELAKLEADAAEYREEQAKYEVGKATRDLERLQRLEADLVSPRDLDDLKYAKDKATAALRVSEFQTRKSKLDVETAQAAIDEHQAREAEVTIQLEEHKIRAPMDGVVSQRMVKGGEAITTATPLFEVVDTANLIAYLDRPQRELALVQEAEHVTFTTDAYPQRKFVARVDLISPVVDRETGSFKIRIRVAPEDAAVLRPGLFARAQILTEANREAIMIPKTAVIADGDDSIVFFVRDPLGGFGKARRLRLETGIEDDAFVECRNTGNSGLRPGDLILVSGQQDLRDQTQVEIGKD